MGDDRRVRIDCQGTKVDILGPCSWDIVFLTADDSLLKPRVVTCGHDIWFPAFCNLTRDRVLVGQGT